MSLTTIHFLPMGKFLKRHALLLFSIACCMNVGSAQESPRDSLKRAMGKMEQHTGFSTRDTTYIDLVNRLGETFRFYKNDSLLLLAQQGLKYSRAAKYKSGEGRSLNLMAHYYSDMGDHPKSIEHYQRALEVSKQANDHGTTLLVLNNMALVYGYDGNYAKSLNSYLKGAELAAKVDDKYMLSVINENIANLYFSQKDYVQAMDFYDKVVKINDQIGNDRKSAETLSNVASLYAEMGNFEYAMFNINKSITVLEKQKIMDWLAYAYEVKGKIYLKQGKFKWALHWYNQCEMLHKELDDDRGKIDLYNGMARAYLGLQKYRDSEHYALEAFKISKEINFIEGIQSCAKTLYRIKKNRRDYATALEYHEIFQEMSDSLSRDENRQGLAMLKTKVDYERQQEALILETERALAAQRTYIYVALAILLVLAAITLLILRGKRIQKALNDELQAKTEVLEKREVELEEINGTKDKLFSIIGHDLRGPIAALQGLLKLFNDGEIERDEFLEFMPKLHSDVDHISFTLNNLLSWGQTQMNGATTRPATVALESLVADNINLLSEIAQKKAIKIVDRLPDNVLVWSDSNQVDIVVRNLISNALKFTPENGTVTIGAEEKNDHWEVSVKDTGVGMDSETQKKIFTKNANITTYGTNNEKGTGLGLSLCREMVEKNNGTIWVESTPHKGSCFYFTLPKAEKTYKKGGLDKGIQGIDRHRPFRCKPFSIPYSHQSSHIPCPIGNTINKVFTAYGGFRGLILRIIKLGTIRQYGLHLFFYKT